MRLEVFDGFTLVDMIYDYASFERERKYAGVGDFTLVLNSLEYAPALQRDRYIMAGGDCYVIENIHKYYDEGKVNVEVTGRSLSSILDRRVVGSFTFVTGSTFETQIYNLVRSNFVTAVDPNRVIPFLTTAASKGIPTTPTTASQEFKNINILEILEEICPLIGLGFRINYNPEAGNMEFEVYKGRDLTDQVFFSENFDNIGESEIYDQGQDYRNVGYLNNNGTLTMTGSGVGIDRREMVVEGTDMAKVIEELAAKKVRTSAECEIILSDQFEYRIDWDLGDEVSVIDTALGFVIESHVREIKETYHSGRKDIDVTFGDRIPTVFDKLKVKG